MKSLSKKPSDACGKSPIVAVFYLDDAGAAIRKGADLAQAGVLMTPLCAEHAVAVGQSGVAVANLGDPRHPSYKEMTCQMSLGRPVVAQAPPPPIAKTPSKRA